MTKSAVLRPAPPLGPAFVPGGAPRECGVPGRGSAAELAP
jgi:hypothetical protein